MKKKKSNKARTFDKNMILSIVLMSDVYVDMSNLEV